MSKVITILSRTARKASHRPAEAFLLLRMAGWVLLLSIAVKLFSLPRALRLVSTKIRLPRENPEGRIQKRLADAVDQLLKTKQFILKPVCWNRAAI